MDEKSNFDNLNTNPIDAELEIDKELEGQSSEDKDLDLEDIVRNLRISSRRDERVIAFFLVYAVDRFDYSISIDDVVEQFRVGFELDVPHDSFAMELARGTVDSRLDLDEQIRPNLKNWKLERLGCCTRLILRMALWELRQPEAIPSIIINEAVELAKSFAEKDAYKFINGILDEICKTLGLNFARDQKEEQSGS